MKNGTNAFIIAIFVELMMVFTFKFILNETIDVYFVGISSHISD
jgi:hypothetical protein